MLAPPISRGGGLTFLPLTSTVMLLKSIKVCTYLIGPEMTVVAFWYRACVCVCQGVVQGCECAKG